eukprot:4299578-Alexandrium_andersonii.AAC.1
MAMWLGTWPDRDAWGRPWPRGSIAARRANTPLAGGWYAALWSIRGDLEWLWKGLGLESYTSLTPCVWCQCDCSAVPWTDFRPSARWRQRVWAEEDWAAAHPRRNAVLQLPGVSIRTVKGDLLHAKHLGVDAYFYASALTFLVFYVLEGSPDDNVARVWAQVRAFDQSRRMTGGFANLRLSMFYKAGQFPVLKGKATE